MTHIRLLIAGSLFVSMTAIVACTSPADRAALAGTIDKLCTVAPSDEPPSLRRLAAIDLRSADLIRGHAKTECMIELSRGTVFDNVPVQRPIVVQIPQPQPSAVVVQPLQPNVINLPPDTRWGDLGAAIGGATR